jgi:PilZ domain
MINDLIHGIMTGFKKYPIEERRQSLRLKCRYAVYALEGKKIHEIMVADIGPRGLRFNTVKKFRAGQKLELIYRGVPGEQLTRLPLRTLQKSESKLPCKVLWCQKETDAYQVGLCFEAEDLNKTWVKPVLDKMGLGREAFTERRRQTRARACINADLRVEEESLTGLLTNIGLGGALFQSDKHLDAGQGVSLTVRSHPKLPVLRVDGDLISHSFDVVSNSGLHNIRFKQMDDETKLILERYVTRLMGSQGSG